MKDKSLDTNTIQENIDLLFGNSYLQKTIGVISIIMVLYQLWGSIFGFPMSMFHRPMHVLFILVLLFLTYPISKQEKGLFSNKKASSAINILFLCFSILSIGFLIIKAEYITTRIPYVEDLTVIEMILGIALILAVLEASRRVIGNVLPIICIVFMVYAYVGNYLPYPFWHRGYSIGRIVEQLYLTLDGIWGTPVYVMSTYVFLFVLFGSVLSATGAGNFFIDLANSLTGHLVGGPAKTSVIACALMGTVTGSASANVMTVGSFSIPLMKKQGYDPEFAGAIVAAASTGGQIMPPVMGTAAFIMVEFTGIPYVNIMLSAIIPAILYFLAIFFMIDVETRKLGFKGLSKDMLPSVWQVLKERGYLLLPLGGIVFFLLIGFTPTRTALGAIIILASLVLIFDPENRRKFVTFVLESFISAARVMIPVTTACAVAGIIVGMLGMTGLGLRISSIVLMLSQGKLSIALILTMIISLILGMGMPTSAAYILVATLLAPGIINMGVPVIAAHMFAFYFACMSALTPPVALASYAAAGVAESNPMRTGFKGFRLGIAAYIIPFIFVYDASMLLQGDIISIITTLITSVVGIYSLATSMQGWLINKLKFYERLMLFAGAILLIKPGLATDLLGTGILLVMFIKQKRQSNIESV